MRKEAVVLGEDAAHFHQVAAEVVLARQPVHAWEMVDFLIGPHFRELVWSHVGVDPLQIPVVLVLVREAHSVFLLAHEAHHVVLGVGHVHDQRARRG